MEKSALQHIETIIFVRLEVSERLLPDKRQTPSEEIYETGIFKTFQTFKKS